ncbi:MAG: ATP-dependent DNA ligase [Halodesulfurarchaeum sp.]
MEYADLVVVYRRLESTESNIEKTRIVAETLESAGEEELERLVKLLQGNLFAERESEELGVSSSLTRSAITRATGIDEDTIEDWWRETGDLGSAAERAKREERQQSLVSERLTVEQVHRTLRSLATFEGSGSQSRRVDEIAGLLSNAEPEEAKYLVRTTLGQLRIGVGSGTIRDAIATAFLDGGDDASAAVERALQVTNDFGRVATVARERGTDGLEELDVELFRPIRVMLAEKAESIEDGIDAVADRPEAVLAEYKYDGVRVQIHVDGADVAVFTRRLEEVTEQFPDVVSAVRTHLDVESAILEGELLGYDPETHDVYPFQTLSRRIKRKYDIEEMAEEIPVVCYLFDLVYVGGESILDSRLETRIDRLTEALDSEDWTIERATHRRNADRESIQSFYEDALSAGHEGIMLKNLEAAYQPGRRVGYMMKVKPTLESLDLVVVRAKYSEGRRRNQLGRLYLGARDEATGDFREVGRLSTGFTDEELAEVTERLESRIIDRDGREVVFDPGVVLEVEFEEIQESPEYDSGYALRFPRFVDFRDDVGLGGVDTVDRIESLYESQ